MATVSATKTYSYALLAPSRDLRPIDQSGTTYDTAAIISPLINTGLIENTASNGIAVDLVRNGIVVNTGTIEAAGTSSIGVRIESAAPVGTGAVVLNGGTISGTLDGIDLAAGGFVANGAGGRIQGSSR